MSEWLGGLVGLAFVILLTVICAFRFPWLSRLLFVALILRTVASLVNAYVFPLPDSTADAVFFEKLAWEYGRDGLFQAISSFPGPDSKFLSWFLSLIYAVFGRSQLLAQSFSVAAGMGTVVVGSLLARELWGGRAAIKAGWLLALFPTLVLYSALVLRESYIWLIFSVALYVIVLWLDRGRIRYFLISFSMFFIAGFFHGAMFLGVVFLLFLIFYEKIGVFVKKLRKFAFDFWAFMFLLFSIIVTFSFFYFDINIPKVGSIKDVFYSDRIVSVVASRTVQSADAVYPEILSIKSSLDAFVKAPLRLMYFIFSPLPWDVRSLHHMVGVLDSILYIYLAFLIWKRRASISSDPRAFYVLMICIGFLLVFSFGVGNFGTGIRHRAKFVVGLIVLAAPLLPRFVMRKNRVF